MIIISVSIKKPDGIQIELDSTKIVDAISKSIIREEEKKNEKKLRNFAILATGNVRASRYIKEPKINMSKLFSGIFTSICFCNFLQDYNERNISVTYIPTTDYEKTIVVTADFVDTTIFGMPVTVKRSTQFGLFYDYFQYDLNIEELYHEYERLLQRRKELRELRKLKIKRFLLILIMMILEVYDWKQDRSLQNTDLFLSDRHPEYPVYRRQIFQSY